MLFAINHQPVFILHFFQKLLKHEVNEVMLQGADLVHVFCPAEAATVIKGYSPELMVHPSYDLNTLQESMHRIDAFILGPGLGRNDSTLSVVQNVIEISKERSLPLIIDAVSFLQQHSPFINRLHKTIVWAFKL